ncbi:translation initiation factor IF-2-like [Tachyglossus aculeatus]|uniref:translation initiation factor IF-2-like n=1 Tax=Tachyglossus aculeatus TaxID=9261 RepID=UPI0018F53348|nr:translation initiation factor IF-2-like [Tachyglossus aculeatus]
MEDKVRVIREVERGKKKSAEGRQFNVRVSPLYTIDVAKWVRQQRVATRPVSRALFVEKAAPTSSDCAGCHSQRNPSGRRTIAEQVPPKRPLGPLRGRPSQGSAPALAPPATPRSRGCSPAPCATGALAAGGSTSAAGPSPAPSEGSASAASRNWRPISRRTRASGPVPTAGSTSSRRPTWSDTSRPTERRWERRSKGTETGQSNLDAIAPGSRPLSVLLPESQRSNRPVPPGTLASLGLTFRRQRRASKSPARPPIRPRHPSPVRLSTPAAIPEGSEPGRECQQPPGIGAGRRAAERNRSEVGGTGPGRLEAATGSRVVCARRHPPHLRPTPILPLSGTEDSLLSPAGLRARPDLRHRPR